MRVSMVRALLAISFGFLTSLATSPPAAFGATDDVLPRGALGVVTNAEVSGGVRILDIIPGTPAANSKLRTGDVILSIDGNSVKSPADVGRIVEPFQPGFNLQLEVDRQGVVGSLWVVVGSKADVERAQKLHTTRHDTESVVRTERFELVDSAGRVLATIKSTGSGGWAVYDRAGNMQWTSAGNLRAVATFDSSASTAVRRYSYYGGGVSKERNESVEPPATEDTNLDYLDPEGPSSNRHPFYRR